MKAEGKKKRLYEDQKWSMQGCTDSVNDNERGHLFGRQNVGWCMAFTVSLCNAKTQLWQLVYSIHKQWRISQVIGASGEVCKKKVGFMQKGLVGTMLALTWQKLLAKLEVRSTKCTIFRVNSRGLIMHV
jgi:hypothetical protein